MGQITLQIPQVGLPDTSEDPKVASDLTTIQATIDGGIDATNLAAALAQSAGVNQAGQVSKGAVNIATTGTRTNTAYGFLNDANDQVTGIVLPTNGLIAVRYQATWQESAAGGASAAIFLGSNAVQTGLAGQSAPTVLTGVIGGTSGTGKNVVLSSSPLGLISLENVGTLTAYTGDVTTGQVVGGGIVTSGVFGGGPCEIFAAAGTYTVSVQFKASSGSVTVSNRKLWVEVKSYA